MKKFPPHLPPRHTESFLKLRRQSLAWLVLFICLSLIASIAASLATIAWIAPSSLNESALYPIHVQTETNEENLDQLLDPVVAQQAAQRLVQVYDARQKVNNTWYTDASHVGQAVLLSSDGWAVMYAPAITSVAATQLEVVNHQGLVFSVEEVLVDPVTQLTYLNIGGDGFRSDLRFQEWDALSLQTSVWAVRGETGRLVRVEEQEKEVSGAARLSELTLDYSLVSSNRTKAGDVLLNEHGYLVGIVITPEQVRIGWWIQTQMNHVFQQGTLQYPEALWRGRVVSQARVDTTVKPFSGFYITESPTRATSSTLGVGDVITEVQGAVFDPGRAWRDMLLSGQEVRLKVIRKDKELELTVPLKLVQPSGDI